MSPTSGFLAWESPEHLLWRSVEIDCSSSTGLGKTETPLLEDTHKISMCPRIQGRSSDFMWSWARPTCWSCRVQTTNSTGTQSHPSSEGQWSTPTSMQGWTPPTTNSRPTSPTREQKPEAKNIHPTACRTEPTSSCRLAQPTAGQVPGQWVTGGECTTGTHRTSPTVDSFSKVKKCTNFVHT